MKSTLTHYAWIRPDVGYEIHIETADKQSYDAIMAVVYEQKDREDKECGKK